MIILRNNSYGGIIRVCMGIFTTALRNKKYVKFSIKIPYLPSAITVAAQDDHLTAGAWAACELPGGTL